jgi:hypothetical protein
MAADKRVRLLYTLAPEAMEQEKKGELNNECEAVLV